jgi:hypothetical protein
MMTEGRNSLPSHSIPTSSSQEGKGSDETEKEGEQKHL